MWQRVGMRTSWIAAVSALAVGVVGAVVTTQLVSGAGGEETVFISAAS